MTENFSFFALGKDFGKKDRKRKKSYQPDESESDVCEVKRRKQESPLELSKVQVTMAQFVDKNSGKDSTSTTVDSSLTLTVDATIEIYQDGHTKKSGF